MFLIINDDNPTCTIKEKKLPLKQKCPTRFVAIKFVKENEIYNVSLWYVFVGLLKTNDVNLK